MARYPSGLIGFGAEAAPAPSSGVDPDGFGRAKVSGPALNPEYYNPDANYERDQTGGIITRCKLGTPQEDSALPASMGLASRRKL